MLVKIHKILAKHKHSVYHISKHIFVEDQISSTMDKLYITTHTIKPYQRYEPNINKPLSCPS